MRRQKAHYPSFFKVLIGDFAKHLPIPPAFVAGRVTALPSSVTIEAGIGSSKASWDVTVEQVGESHCFTLGWNELVKQFKLNVGDFAAFKLVSDTVFTVVFYGPNCCEKKASNARDDGKSVAKGGKANSIPKGEVIIAKPARKMSKKSAEVVEGDGRGQSFKVLMKRHRRYALRIPEDFITKTGIAGKKQVVLRNGKGQVWPVDLAVRRCGYTDLTSGWADFRRANEIVEGRVCVFKFIEDNVILVKKLLKKHRR